ASAEFRGRPVEGSQKHCAHSAQTLSTSMCGMRSSSCHGMSSLHSSHCTERLAKTVRSNDIWKRVASLTRAKESRGVSWLSIKSDRRRNFASTVGGLRGGKQSERFSVLAVISPF